MTGPAACLQAAFLRTGTSNVWMRDIASEYLTEVRSIHELEAAFKQEQWAVCCFMGQTFRRVSHSLSDLVLCQPDP